MFVSLHAIYRAASAASGSTARSFIAKPQAANSQLSQITRVLGSQLWASQRRLFTDEARDAVSEERKPFVRPISKRSFGLPPTRPSPEPKSTVYVGNILFDITAADLKEYASKYGKVVGSRIIYDSRGLSRGFGYVKFENIEEAKKAVNDMHLSEFEGRKLSVNYAQMDLKEETPQRTIEPTRTVFVGNIAHQITDRDLHELFDSIPNVFDVRVAVDRRTGMPRGFAHAEFTDVESAIAGFEALKGKAPYGRPLRLDYSHSTRRPGETDNSRAPANSAEGESAAQTEAQPQTQQEVAQEAQQEANATPSEDATPKAAQI
ncbi:nucleic acid-binding protein [Microsporum canis CBS 113480]|uniref:Nucleic acid-binding protein n=1 Tax=Arthroderma otae (strain ATCC MYA-4605 / CBS 113480) TaxID=554155 RepID=C5FWT6_ARTOC|nr:nucleic acid-binding protein [Microsporum canis CBS 113480]EEQ34776.1 nucleic acid-binding protein [Microsporum canis CBS 113480]